MSLVTLDGNRWRCRLLLITTLAGGAWDANTLPAQAVDYARADRGTLLCSEDFFYDHVGDNGLPDHVALIRQLAAWTRSRRRGRTSTC